MGREKSNKSDQKKYLLIGSSMFLLLIVVLSLTACSFLDGLVNNMTSFSVLKAGINVSSQDIYRQNLSTPNLTVTDFNRIKSWGLDFIQIDQSWSAVTPKRDGAIDYAYVTNLDKVIHDASSVGLKIIIKTSINSWSAAYTGFWGFEDLWNDIACKEAFIQYWEFMVNRYESNPHIVAWFLLNEPIPASRITEKLWTDIQKQWVYNQWNNGTYLDAVISRVRVIDPNRPLIVAYGLYGNPNNYASFKPRPFSNLIYAFSWYLPISVTHYGQDWNGTIDNMRYDITDIINFRDTYNVSIYCQETGINTYDYPMTTTLDSIVVSRLSWVDNSLQMLNSYKIPWCFYVYSHWFETTGGGLKFGVVDRGNNELTTVPIIKANIPK